MFASSLRILYDYNQWANERILEAAGRLAPDQLGSGNAGNGSVHETLVHIASVEWVFLERWHGRSPAAQWEPAELPDLSALRVRWSSVQDALRQYLAGVTDSELCEDSSYTNFQGIVWTYPLWQQLLHVVNHGTQHRSEVAAELTRHGHSPGWLDFLFFLDERSSTSTD